MSGDLLPRHINNSVIPALPVIAGTSEQELSDRRNGMPVSHRRDELPRRSNAPWLLGVLVIVLGGSVALAVREHRPAVWALVAVIGVVTVITCLTLALRGGSAAPV